MAAVVAQMWDGDHMNGGWWWAMGIGWLVFLAAIVVIVVLLTRHSISRSSQRTSAEEILAERFAKGEIDEQEYRSRRDALGR